MSDFIPPIIAHRGASAYAPENTLIAFIKAAQMGVKWVEFDVMQANSGEIVVFHDETLTRTTGGSGKLASYSYSYLKELDVGSWFDPLYGNERIPTLQQVLKLLDSSALCANIEIKPVINQEEKLVIQLVKELSQYLAYKPHTVLFSSFSFKALQLLRTFLPGALIGVLMHRWESNWYEKTNALQAVSLHVNNRIITKKRVELIKSNAPKNHKLLIYTINNKKRADELFSLGVDALFSDKPDILLG